MAVRQVGGVQVGRARKEKGKVAFTELVMKIVLVCMCGKASDNLSIVLGARCSVDAGVLSYFLEITVCQVFRNSTDTVKCVLSAFVLFFLNAVTF